MSNIESIKNTKDDFLLAKYFEVGCLCLLTGRINKADTQDLELAADYYMEQCTCSRHPESATRECWDRQLNKAEKAELKLSIKELIKARNKKAEQTEALLKIARHKP